MIPPTVIGVDLSLTGTGIAAPSGQRTIRTNAADPVEQRLMTIRRAVLDTPIPEDGWPGGVTVEVATNVVVILEDLVTRSPAASTLGMVHGIVRVALTEADVPFVLVPPATLKKYITGKGNAKKPDMRMAVYQRFGLDLADDNQVDAYGLRAMGLDAYGSPLAQLPAAQRESLDKVTWPTAGERAA